MTSIAIIRKNTPELIKNLVEIGYKQSEYCNEGNFIKIQENKFMLIYHDPFKKFIDCGINEELFIQTAKELFQH